MKPMWIGALTAAAMGLCGAAHAAGPSDVIDLAFTSTDSDGLRRVYGHTGSGAAGLPVAGGSDVDGDGHVDTAFSAMQASPLSRTLAGEVYLVFGNGKVRGSLDTATDPPAVLTIVGDVDQEAAGSELWMDDVTGDGLGDLLIARQNYTPDPGRVGAGALSIVVGGAALRTLAGGAGPFDLRDWPPPLPLVTFVGAAQMDRLGIWVHTGDVTGDGIADIVVGADQASAAGPAHHGEIYVIRGGAHLAASQVIDLAGFGATALAGHIARVRPPAASAHFHFGATCQIADLDGNGTAEVLASAALNRAGAALPPASSPGGTHATGGTPEGTLYVAWDDNFGGNPWTPGLAFEIDASPGSHSIVDGGSCNLEFGEEILGGLDYDGDGDADLFVGDIVGDCSGEARPNSGTGYVFYDAAGLKGLVFDLDAPPPGLVTTTLYGGASGDVAGDTAVHGDFDGDGHADLALCSPHAARYGRDGAGVVHVLHGLAGVWPAVIDLKIGALPAPGLVRITEVIGALGTASASDHGDVLCYSATSGDVDGDGRTDLITNEMMGNGAGPGPNDVGNLIVLGGTLFGPKVPALGPGARSALALMLAAIGAIARLGWLAARRGSRENG